MLTGTLLAWSLGGSALAADATADAQTQATPGANAAAGVGVAVVQSNASIKGDAVYAGQSELSDLIDKMRAQRAATGVASIADIRHLLYFEVQDQWKQKGYTTPPGVDIKLDAGNAAALVAQEDTGIPAPRVVDSVAEACPKESYDPAVTGPPQKLIAMNETNTVGWNVKVPQAGLYQVNVKFFPCQGKRATIEAAFAVNGQFQYEEAQRLVFRRSWRDASLPSQDNRGNDIPPQQELVPAWIDAPLEDQGAWYVKPLLFYFDKGVNRVGLSLTREPIALAQVDVESAETLPSYADVKASYQQAGYKPVEGAFIKVQAEDTYLHSDPTLRAQYGRDPGLEPPAGALQRLNLFGDFPWRDPHQWGEWKIDVPKDGLYKIGFSVWQGFRNDVPSYRQVYIDGKMPFEELRAFPFYPSKQWKVVTLGDKNEPYLFYLTKGEHTIKLRNTEGSTGKLLEVIQNSTRELSTIVQQIKVITGDHPDPNLDLHVYDRIDGLLDKLTAISKEFKETAAYADGLSDQRAPIVDEFLMDAATLDNMVKYRETIQNRLDAFGQIQNSLGTYETQLLQSPLRIDWLAVVPPDVNFPDVSASAAAKLVSNAANFMSSFHINYTGVGSVYNKDSTDKVIEVWVARGREWAVILKQLAEETFTPTTGIHVNVNVLPPGQAGAGGVTVVILSATTGKVPDVVSGVDPGTPVNFAIRGGAYDLTQFPDYKQVASWFRPGSLTPYHYCQAENWGATASGYAKGSLNGATTDVSANVEDVVAKALANLKQTCGNYALPEQQGFGMLFYRTDILAAIGAAKPETWTDVLKTLPSLQENGMNFWYPLGPENFYPILFQFGGNLYDKTGYYSALDTPEALDAFKLWTSLWSQYKLPLDVNGNFFYSRFRTGEIPLGIGSYNDYVAFANAAPEITGFWKMSPVPGVPGADGVINRTTGGGVALAATTTTMMYKGAKHPQESWQFIKWWLSAPTQEQYARDLEAIIGSTARWNTANVEALANEPWPVEDLAAVLEQWKYLREPRVVLGDYISSRWIDFAWNNVVLSNLNPRQSLEEAVRQIDKEMHRKQEEFGIDLPEKYGRIDVTVGPASMKQGY